MDGVVRDDHVCTPSSCTDLGASIAKKCRDANGGLVEEAPCIAGYALGDDVARKHRSLS